jgi:hypothetical protein
LDSNFKCFASIFAMLRLRCKINFWLIALTSKIKNEHQRIIIVKSLVVIHKRRKPECLNINISYECSSITVSMWNISFYNCLKIFPKNIFFFVFVIFKVFLVKHIKKNKF